MSTETQQPHELDKFQTWWGYHGQYCRAGGGEYEESFAWAAWQAAQSSQAAEIEALKADIATYVRAASEQATEIEALRKGAKRGFMCATSFHHEVEHAARGVRIFPDLESLKDARPCWEECGVIEVLILEAAMQTKEAS